MLDFLHPWALLFLLLLPLFLVKKKGLWILRVLRSLVFAGLILALSSPVLYFCQPGGKLTYLVDRSRSAGLSLDLSSLPSLEGVESSLVIFGNDQGTDIGKALNEASSLTEKGKIVLISDGRDTAEGVEEGIEACKRRGIKVDVLPVAPPFKDSAIFLFGPHITFPNSAFPLEVQISSTFKGKREISLKIDGLEILKKDLEINEGNNFLTFYPSFKEGGIHKIEGDLSSGDFFLENDHYEFFVQVRERQGILLVSRSPSRDGFSQFLEEQGVPFKTIVPEDFPNEPQVLSLFDAVILLDVKAEDLDSSQVKSLSSFLRFSGGNLLVLGGGNSFTLGDYFRSPLEDLLPVISSPQLEQDIPQMALLFVVDNSSSMWKSSGGVQKLDIAEEVAVQAAVPLRPFDSVGVLFFSDQPQWALPLGSGRNFEEIKEKIYQRGPGGGTNAYLALQEAYKALEGNEATLKHVIFISDGKSSEGDFQNLVLRGRDEGIYTTAIAVGEDADLEFMKMISQIGEGKFAQVTATKGIPEVIFPPSAEKGGKKIEEGTLQAEFRSSPAPFPPMEIPPLEGYLKTRLKDKAYAVYEFPNREPLLAFWIQGKGKVLCWMSDFQGPFSQRFSEWEGFSSFWAPIINWIASPQEDLSLFDVIRGNSLQLTMYSQEEPPPSVSLEGPQGKVAQFQMRRAGEGKFFGETLLWGRGSYLLNVFQNEKKFVKAFWFSDLEVQKIGLNKPLLEWISDRTGGKILEEISPQIFSDLPLVRKEFSLRGWLIVLVLCLFLLEIFLNVRMKFSKKT
ncbi:MAG: VWA domain-containing protein [Caldiserica bacterium]|jgi:uncharacterized membrane protein|nr:VWA domain-containing protein [Caldisericota bacterium]MDH7562645.1 VWA domain-containing protein [Caldisericota bacterium]